MPSRLLSSPSVDKPQLNALLGSVSILNKRYKRYISDQNADMWYPQSMSERPANHSINYKETLHESSADTIQND